MNSAGFSEQLQKMKADPGFIAALDQSGGSTPGALRLYGIKEDAGTSQRPPAQKSRRRGELLAGAVGRAVGPAIRCRVQRPAG